MNSVRIGRREVGPGSQPYVIAEMSGNHNGSFDRALAILEAAARAGADAVKLQTYTADTMTLDVDDPAFRVADGLWKGFTLHELYQQAQTPWEWHAPLIERGGELGVHVFSAPFDATAVDFLVELDVPALKIASFELVDIPLVQRAAATGLPIILSTGMADLSEIRDAVDAARAAGAVQVILLHCVSGYPTPVEEANLRTISALREDFDLPVGLSDHTPGTAVAIAAVALGACVVEKHLTLARADGGPDAAFSLEPEEFTELVAGCRASHAALGQAGYQRKPSEAENLVFRRSLYVVADVAEGEQFTADKVRSIRPGYGLPPKELVNVLGRRATRPLRRGTPLELGMVT